MKPKYRRGTRYAYMLTFNYSPLPNPPGTLKIGTSTGSFVLTETVTALAMMNEVMRQAKIVQGIDLETAIFPVFYHVEEQYQKL